MKKKTNTRPTATKKAAVMRHQLNIEPNQKVWVLLAALKKNTNLKLAMKGKMSYPKLVHYGLSLLARQYKVKVAKPQLNLFK